MSWTERNCEDWAEDRLGDGRTAVVADDDLRGASTLTNVGLDSATSSGDQQNGGDWRSDGIARELSGDLLKALTARYQVLNANTKLRLLLALLSVPSSHRRRYFSELAALLETAQQSTAESTTSLDLCFFAPLMSLHRQNAVADGVVSDDNANANDDEDEAANNNFASWACTFETARLCSEDQLQELFAALAADNHQQQEVQRENPLLSAYLSATTVQQTMPHTSHFQLRTPLRHDWIPPADLDLSDEDELVPSSSEVVSLRDDNEDSYRPTVRLEGGHSRRVSRIKRVDIDDDPEERILQAKRARHPVAAAVPQAAMASNSMAALSTVAEELQASEANALDDTPAVPTTLGLASVKTNPTVTASTPAARPSETEDVADLLSSVLGATPK